MHTISQSKQVDTLTLIEEGKVYATREYDRFTNYFSNRKVDPNKVKRLKDSMELRYLISPILVNEDLKIVDGQHRYAAVVELGKVLYFLVKDGLSESDIPIYNTNSKNWGFQDYLESYTAEGLANYVLLSEYMQRYKLPIRTAISFMIGKNKIDQYEFESGNFEIPPGFNLDSPIIKQFYEIRETLKENDKYAEKYIDNRAFTQVFMYLLSHKDYSHGEMIKKLNHKKMFQDGSNLNKILQSLSTAKRENTQFLLDSFQEIYNFDRRTGSVDFK